MESKTNNKKLGIILGIALVVIIAVFLLINYVFMPKAQAGSKNVTIEVVHVDGTSKNFEYKTDEEYLGALIQNEGLAVGKDGPYGMYITEVDGYVADESNTEWWCITRGGEEVYTAADETVLEDGSKFELTLMVGYD